MIDGIKLKVTNQLKHFIETPDVKSKYSDDEKIEINKAAKQFESLLTGLMLKSMTQTTGGFFGENSFGTDYFDTIFQQELASEMSEKQSLGIAEKLYERITGEKYDPLLDLSHREKLDLRPPKIDIKNINNNSNIIPSRTSVNRLNKYENYINEAAQKFGLDKNLIKSIILTESAARENAVSKANAKGLMQLIDSTAQDMGVNNVWDPKQNIMGGTKYLSNLLRQYNGDLELALAGYNAGPGNIEKYNGIPPFKETKNYISRVTGYLNHFNSF